jgi:uncharacterized protein
MGFNDRSAALTTLPAPPLAPLDADDFDALDAELDLLRESSEEIPQWEFCEGFLAALVCMRRPVPPEEYWPVLLGEDFNPMEHMEFVARWRRRWSEIATALDAPVETLDDDRTFQPEVMDTRGAVLALPQDERTAVDMEEVPAFAQVWALGFMYAVEAWPEDWQPPRDPDAAEMLDNALGAIVALSDDDEGKPSISMYQEDGPPSVSCGRAWARRWPPSARRRSLAATIPVPAAAARSTRNATAPAAPGISRRRNEAEHGRQRRLPHRADAVPR